MCSKFRASSLELCKCFKHTPLLYNHKEAQESLQLSPLASTLDSARRLGVRIVASLMTWLSQPTEKKEHSQGGLGPAVPGYTPRPPDPQLGTPPTHSTKSGLGMLVLLFEAVSLYTLMTWANCSLWSFPV